MQTEIEVKFLGTDHDVVRAKPVSLGAKCVQPMTTMKRYNMDFPDKKLEKNGGWLRVRDMGNKITLTYKNLESWTLTGVSEIEVEVSDFEKTHELLTAIGMTNKGHQITRRETWTHQDVEIVLDEWPWIKPFIEIEGPSEMQVQKIAKALGFDWKDAVFGSVEPAYIAEYDITEQDFYTLQIMSFDIEPPEWLVARKRA